MSETGRSAPRTRTSRSLHGLCIAVLLILVALGSVLRTEKAFRDPNFRKDDPVGLLRSDPALLFYFVERIIEAGGGIPDDFRRDPRVEYPNEVDLLEDFTIGQEFVVAWCHLLFGGDLAVHALAVIIMAVCASLTALGVYGIAWELTRSPLYAVFAALLYSILPANYRTIGFILIREDFSVPWFALHLFLILRAHKTHRLWLFVASAVALSLALATWHAMAFVVAVEVAVFFGWAVRSGKNPFAARGMGVFLCILAALSLLIPVLRSKLFLLSLPMQMGLALFVCARLPWLRRQKLRLQRLFPVAILLLLVPVAAAISAVLGAGLSDYSHVFALFAAKLYYLGEFPEDPAVIPFGARLLWQGPFDTCPPDRLYFNLLAVLVLLVPFAALHVPLWFVRNSSVVLRLLLAVIFAGSLSFALKPGPEFDQQLKRLEQQASVVRSQESPDRAMMTRVNQLIGKVKQAKEQIRSVWVKATIAGLIAAALMLFLLRRPTADSDALLAAGGLSTILLAFLIQRLLILPGLLLPVVAVVLLQRIRQHAPKQIHPGMVTGIIAALTLATQGHSFYQFVERSKISWYRSEQTNELARVVHWLNSHRQEVPAAEPILADFVSSTAVLAHTRHPIILQPKYETVEARRRAEEFYSEVLLGDMNGLRELMARYDTRFLLIHRLLLLGSKPMVGLAADSAPPDDAPIRVFMSQDESVLDSIPGLQLIYRSPDFLTTDLYRLYKVREPSKGR